jgi:hypothetical protein
MPIKNHTKQIKNIFFLLFFISVNADAAFNDSRTGKWAFFLAPMVTNSKVLQFDNGAEAAINKRSGLGLGFGYNLNHHIELISIPAFPQVI